MALDTQAKTLKTIAACWCAFKAALFTSFQTHDGTLVCARSVNFIIIGVKRRHLDNKPVVWFTFSAQGVGLRHGFFDVLPQTVQIAPDSGVRIEDNVEGVLKPPDDRPQPVHFATVLADDRRGHNPTRTGGRGRRSLDTSPRGRDSACPTACDTSSSSSWTPRASGRRASNQSGWLGPFCCRANNTTTTVVLKWKTSLGKLLSIQLFSRHLSSVRLIYQDTISFCAQRHNYRCDS